MLFLRFVFKTNINTIKMTAILIFICLDIYSSIIRKCLNIKVEVV